MHYAWRSSKIARPPKEGEGRSQEAIGRDNAQVESLDKIFSHALMKRAGARSVCVMNEHIDTARFFAHARDGLLDCPCLKEIKMKLARLIALAFKLRPKRPQPLEIAPAQIDEGACLGERLA